MNLKNYIIKAFKDLNHFIDNKIKNYLINDDFLDKNNIIIGSYLSQQLNASIGDTLILSFPLDINIVSKHVPSKRVIISGIFDIDLFDYDDRYIICSFETINDKLTQNTRNEFYINGNLIDKTKMLNENIKLKNDNLLVSALKLEKKIYVIIGFLVVLISSIMLFTMTLLGLIEKINQIKILKILSIRNNQLFIILFIKNLIIGIVLVLLAYLVAESSILLNYKYKLLNFLFESFPFKLIPFQVSFFKNIMISFTLIIITIVAGVTPIFLFSRLKRSIN